MKIQPRPSQPTVSTSTSSAATQTATADPVATPAPDQFSEGEVGGTGRLGLADPNVAVARRDASAHERDRVNWTNPGETLDHLSQIDSDRGVQQGGNDAVRCGAANLVGSTILLGPQATHDSMGRVQERGQHVLSEFRKLRDEFPRNSNEYRQVNSLVTMLEHSQDTLSSLRSIPPERLTVGDMQRYQEAVYTQGVLDQRLSSNRQYSETDFTNDPTKHDHGYLRTGAMQTYRDLMWGGRTPQMNGKDLDIYWVDNEDHGGHFVLANRQAEADGSRSVAYNPWPDSDGTAFSRAHDGNGARVVPLSGRAQEGSQLRGMNVDQSGHRLPAR